LLIAQFVVSLVLKIIFEFQQTIFPARPGSPDYDRVSLPPYDLKNENWSSFQNFKKQDEEEASTFRRQMAQRVDLVQGRIQGRHLAVDLHHRKHHGEKKIL